MASSLASSSASVISLEDSDTNESTGEHVQLIVKKNTTSEVWQYFGFVQDDTGNPIDRDSPKCKLCFENVPAKWSNTSDLYYHLKKTHQAVYVQVRAKQTMRVQENKSGCGQQILEQCMDRTKKYSPTSKEQLTKAVTFCIAKDMLPIYTADKKGFCEMVKALNPRYELPHKKLL